MKNKCQNLTEEKRNELLKLLQKFKELSDGSSILWIKREYRADMFKTTSSTECTEINV